MNAAKAFKSELDYIDYTILKKKKVLWNIESFILILNKEQVKFNKNPSEMIMTLSMLSEN